MTSINGKGAIRQELILKAKKSPADLAIFIQQLSQTYFFKDGEIDSRITYYDEDVIIMSYLGLLEDPHDETASKVVRVDHSFGFFELSAMHAEVMVAIIMKTVRSCEAKLKEASYAPKSNDND